MINDAKNVKKGRKEDDTLLKGELKVAM